MVRYRTLLGIAFILLLTSCGLPEQLPKPETVLPKGYSEKIVPKTFVKEMGLDFGAGEMWMRCIDCNEDWDGLNAHLLSTLGPKGYTDTSLEWAAVLDKGADPTSEESQFMNRVMRMYSSKLGYAHIMLVDLNEMKELGAQLSTSGDFLVIAGFGDIKKY